MMPINVETFMLLMCALLIFWKATGLTCFTAGLVRARNTNDILAKNVVLFAITVLFFIPVTQSIIFSHGINAYVPSFRHDLIKNSSTSLFQQATTLFEMLIALIPLYIITGATAERLRFWPFLLFSLFYLGVIYPVVAYWTWGNGFLHTVGFIDYGGAAVLHISGAVAALAALIYLGVRQGHYDEQKKTIAQPGANIPFAMLGAMQIWFGSIGLNVGTALLNAPQGLLMAHVSLVIINTMIAGSAGLIGALIITRIVYGTIDVTLLFNGALAGIVALSANPLLMQPSVVVLIGFVAGIITMLSLKACNRLRIDDPIGAVSVHGAGGLWGILAVSFSLAYLPVQNQTSLFYGHNGQFLLQLLGVVCIIAWVFVVSLLVWSIIRFTVGLRIKPDDEFKGMDILTCGMNAYPEFITPGQEKS
ncbi:MAG: ammonium transporter [Gammaproteobacteria bacterium]|nr:ammonium transporter [Gammaproteobacteria bacterium]